MFILPCSSNYIRILKEESDGKSTIPREVFWPQCCDNDTWEHDYIRELFPSPYFIHVNQSLKPDVAICSNPDHVRMIEEIYKNHHIYILVHISDEFLGKNVKTLSCSKLYEKDKGFSSLSSVCVSWQEQSRI